MKNGENILETFFIYDNYCLIEMFLCVIIKSFDYLFVRKEKRYSRENIF